MTTKKYYRRIANEVFKDNRPQVISDFAVVPLETVNNFVDFINKAIDKLPDDPKSCPFCGSNEGINYIRSFGAIESVTTECKNCKAKGPKATKLDDESWEQVEMEAVELWNTRTDEHHE